MARRSSLALVGYQAAVEAIELVYRGLNAVVVEPHALHELDKLALQPVVAPGLRFAERLVLLRELQAQVLEATELLVGDRNRVEGLDHLGPNCGLHRRERDVALVEVVLALALLGAGGLAASRCPHRQPAPRHRPIHRPQPWSHRRAPRPLVRHRRSPRDRSRREAAAFPHAARRAIR